MDSVHEQFPLEPPPHGGWRAPGPRSCFPDGCRRISVASKALCNGEPAGSQILKGRETACPWQEEVVTESRHRFDVALRLELLHKGSTGVINLSLSPHCRSTHLCRRETGQVATTPPAAPVASAAALEVEVN